MDTRAFAAPKVAGLRLLKGYAPRRRVKPAYDDLKRRHYHGDNAP